MRESTKSLFIKIINQSQITEIEKSQLILDIVRKK